MHRSWSDDYPTLVETPILTGVRVALIALAMMSVSRSEAPFAGHPGALWRVVHDLCVPDKAILGFSAPCLAVDRAGGFAVVPDPNGRTQILLTPTRRITGIESPDLLSANVPNYWRAAWNARGYLERRAGQTIPREDIAMAINSHNGRTQNQLHIHIDCVRIEVREALKKYAARLPDGWSRFPIGLFGHRYRVLRLTGEDLGRRDPFKLLAAGDERARADMGGETLAVVGVNLGDGPGFVILAARDSPDNPEAAAEEIIDHGCVVLH